MTEPRPAGPVTQAADLLGLAVRVHTLARDTGRSICTAESCTGGLVGHLLTEVPGASASYRGGVVSYADSLKGMLLGVTQEAIEGHGAVSAQVAVAMAEGARTLCGADLAVSVTGIAGPDGGTDAKPVGTTYVAVADAQGHEVRRFLWHGDRSANKHQSAAAALELLIGRLEGSTHTEAGR